MTCPSTISPDTCKANLICEGCGLESCEHEIKECDVIGERYVKFWCSKCRENNKDRIY